jgi:dienelactone hydrolase
MIGCLMSALSEYADRISIMQINAAPTLPAPQTLTEWLNQRESIRARFWQLLGDLPPLFTPQPTVLERTTREGCVVERFAFDNGASAMVYGYLLLPEPLTAPAPAVVYMHMHGGEYEVGKEELFRERVPGILPGPALVNAGYVVMAIDAYSFGERVEQGPKGSAESGRQVEHALFKHFLWQGATLWGMMVRDDLLALNYLLTRPEVDPERIGVTGMSLGGSRTTWLAALDERPRALVPVAQMTRYRDFAASGHYNGHSVYYYVPGVFKTDLDMEHLVALAAPRAQTILAGDTDPLSPLSGIQSVLAYARQVYDLYGAGDQLQSSIEAGIRHLYTPTMFEMMLSTINHALLSR